MIRSPLSVLLLLLAAACTPHRPAADHVVEYRPRCDTAALAAPAAEYVKIFLAGTIDMGDSDDWQARTVGRFRAQAPGRILFFNPRRPGRPRFDADEMAYQVRWELDRLEEADWIVMNLLGSSKSPVSLLEMGLHMRSGKLLVACDPDFYRRDNVRITCLKYGVPLYDSLDELLDDRFF